VRVLWLYILVNSMDFMFVKLWSVWFSNFEFWIFWMFNCSFAFLHLSLSLPDHVPCPFFYGEICIIFTHIVYINSVVNLCQRLGWHFFTFLLNLYFMYTMWNSKITFNEIWQNTFPSGFCLSCHV
jgi:hypothetical protein